MGRTWSQRHLKSEKDKSLKSKKPKSFKEKERESVQQDTYWSVPGTPTDIEI